MKTIRPINFDLNLLDKTNLMLDVCQFVFKKPKGFSFIPGQYLDMFQNINGRKDYRSFSISSSPTENEIILTIKSTGSEFKKKLFDLQKGERVNFYGPLGGFVIDESKSSIALISGGLGITPFRSMLRFNYDKNLNTKLILFAFFSRREDAIFYNELNEMSKDKKNIKIIYSLTTESKNDWNGEIGRISKEILNKCLENFQNMNYMIAGPTEMVDYTQDLLKKNGVSENRVRIEYYPGYN